MVILPCIIQCAENLDTDARCKTSSGYTFISTISYNETSWQIIMHCMYILCIIGYYTFTLPPRRKRDVEAKTSFIRYDDDIRVQYT